MVMVRFDALPRSSMMTSILRKATDVMLDLLAAAYFGYGSHMTHASRMLRPTYLPVVTLE